VLDRPGAARLAVQVPVDKALHRPVGVNALVPHAAHHLVGHRTGRGAYQAGQVDLLDDVPGQAGEIGAGDDPVDVDPGDDGVEVDAVEDAGDVDLVDDGVEVDPGDGGVEVDAVEDA